MLNSARAAQIISAFICKHEPMFKYFNLKKKIVSFFLYFRFNFVMEKDLPVKSLLNVDIRFDLNILLKNIIPYILQDVESLLDIFYRK